MKYLSRVVWSEGMYLGPHHFQVQNRYFEDSIRFSTANLWFEPWGLVGLKLDAEALQNGTVNIVHCRGIFPDAMPFHMPESDAVPQPRSVEGHFPRSGDGVVVSLGVPARKADGLNCVPPGTKSDGVRFTVQPETMHDETNGRDEKPVNLGLKNIRIVFGTEDSTGLTLLPIARVIRESSGKYGYDPNYIPPVLRITSSDRLMSLLGRLIEILEEKSASFASRKTSWIEIASREVGTFWLIHTINSAMAPLRHLYLTKRSHPDELYQEMLRLGGALCTFALESHPRTLPLYNHNDLTTCFSDLDYHIRRHLEIVIPTQFITIPLVKRAEYFYEAEITDQRALNKTKWVFGVKSEIGEAPVIANTPRLVKLCSKEFVPRLVQQALPGLTLTHLPVAPQQIPAKVDYSYFSVSQAGPCWEHMVKTRKLGLYVPGDIPNPELELLVIIES
ncbi:MAG TPA: type VI secretion system baseplate subunit TssK [Bryobacteraceae bacterium]|jgi:type VI secretion system protein ImpJ